MAKKNDKGDATADLKRLLAKLADNPEHISTVLAALEQSQALPLAAQAQTPTSSDAHVNIEQELADKSRRGRKAVHKIDEFVTSEEQARLGREAAQNLARQRANRPAQAFRAFLREHNLESHSVINIAKDAFGQAAFIKLNDNKYCLVYMTYTESKQKSRLESYFEKSEGTPNPYQAALAVFQEFQSPTLDGHIFTDLNFYKSRATELVNTAAISLQTARRFPKRLGFVLAFYCARKKWDSKVVSHCQRVLDKVKNVPLLEVAENETAAFTPWLLPILTRLATLDRKRDGRSDSKSGQFKHFAGTLKSAFKTANARFGRFIGGLNLEAELTDEIKVIAETLNDEGNYPGLPIDDVKQLLSFALERHSKFYCYIMLQLSTCLRNQEMERLSRAYFTDNQGSALLYKAPVNKVYLTQKSVKKIGEAEFRRKIRNPTTSIVTRVIMKYFEYEFGSEHKDFFEKNSKVRAALKEPSGHQRSLRTTAATNLRFGIITDVARPIDPKEIAARMCHINEIMVTTVYARTLPIDAENKHPDDYFEIEPLELDVDGEVHVVGDKEYAWDLWLLDHFATTMKALMSQDEFDDLKRKIVFESNLNKRANPRNGKRL